MKDLLEKKIAEASKDLFGIDVKVELTRPEEQFGDYAANIVFKLAKDLGKSPSEIGETLSNKLRSDLGEQLREVSVAAPGFINLKLSDHSLLAALKEEPKKSLSGQTVIAEYSDPNPFKVLHAGHLYTSIVGESIANLLEEAGGKVHRVNFGGDVGLHVARNMWAIIQFLEGENPEKLAEIPEEKRPDWLSERYVEGNKAYENNEQAKQAIIDINTRVYELHSSNDHESPFAQIYWTCRQWSYDYFNKFYERLGSHFEKYYPESETAPLGLRTVREHIGDVYSESQGAIIFDGEKYGMHTRVFINSKGLPTYEAKDVGLIMKKWADYRFDISVIITGNDIIEYMKVVQKSVELFMPELAERSRHLTHGQVKLAGGAKMSSRLGNVLRAVDVLNAAAQASKAINEHSNDQTVLGAVKYAFLKNRIGGDIIYDPEQSVSVEGNSGPYLQYAHARARSILSQADNVPAVPENAELGKDERTLTRKISEYPEVINQAVQELMPHYITTYLYELAQVFNRFYENNRVMGDDRQELRLALVKEYADRLKAGLEMLGIAAPAKM